MRPTRWPFLVVAALLAGGVSYAWTRSSYDSNPRPSAGTIIALALLDVAVFYVVYMTRARLAGRPGTRPIDPLAVARFVALAKAGAVVGALAAGGYAGFLAWVGRLESPAASTDTTVAAFGVGVSIVLTGAALFLEQVCRVPKDDDDQGGDNEDLRVPEQR